MRNRTSASGNPVNSMMSSTPGPPITVAVILGAPTSEAALAADRTQRPLAIEAELALALSRGRDRRSSSAPAPIAIWTWRVIGALVGLLVSLLTLLAALCPPAEELVFGITILGALIGGIVGWGARRLFERTSAFLIGMSLGFAAAFVLIFFVFVHFIPEC